MSKAWEIFKKFKSRCSFRGWNASENEDWIKADGKYHNFLWARDIHPSSFKRIASNKKCVIKDGLGYHVVESSYTAWLFSKPLSETLVNTISENPDFAGRIALYDLSPLVEEKNFCFKLNHTDSPVFQEFEHFLTKELKVKLKPILVGCNAQAAEGDCTIGKLA